MSKAILKTYGDVYTHTHNPKFPVPEKKDFMEFKKLLDNDEHWKVGLNKNGTKVLFRDEENEEVLQVKLKTTKLLDIPIHVVHDVLQDPDYRSLWDERMKSQHLTEQLDENSEIGYYSLKMPFTLANRDWVNMRSWWFNKEETLFIIMNHSVIHPNEPEKKKYVRATSLQTGYILEKTEEGTILNYFSWNLWNGWIPNWCVNKATKTMVSSSIDDLRKACLNYPEWKKQHDPKQKYWSLPGKEIIKGFTED